MESWPGPHGLSDGENVTPTRLAEMLVDCSWSRPGPDDMVNLTLSPVGARGLAAALMAGVSAQVKPAARHEDRDIASAVFTTLGIVLIVLTTGAALAGWL